MKHTIKLFSCKVCDYHSAKLDDLNEHTRVKHAVEGRIQCRNCGKNYHTKVELMIHRKAEHFNIVAPCMNYPLGKCNYTADMCWWSHREGATPNIECYFCESTFDTRTAVMKHRKAMHPKTIKPCLQFLNSNCHFTEEMCWFKHENKSEESSESVFREGLKNQQKI